MNYDILWMGSALLALICVGAFSIWCGVYFGIYSPFLISYNPTRCRVNAWTDWGSYDRFQHKVHFRKLFLSVEIDGSWYPGFGCEADGSGYSTGVMDTPFNYAYAYSECTDWFSYNKTSCESSEKFVPRWLCSEWSKTSSFQQGEIYDCKYIIRNGDSLSGLNDKKTGKSTKFLEVIFDDETYHRPSYIALMVVCLGILCILPAFIFIFCSIPSFFYFEPYKKLFRCLRRGIRLFRKHVLCCKYRDPDIAMVNRKVLFRHAAVSSLLNNVQIVLIKKIDDYIPSGQGL